MRELVLNIQCDNCNDVLDESEVSVLRYTVTDAVRTGVERQLDLCSTCIEVFDIGYTTEPKPKRRAPAANHPCTVAGCSRIYTSDKRLNTHMVQVHGTT